MQALAMKAILFRQVFVCLEMHVKRMEPKNTKKLLESMNSSALRGRLQNPTSKMPQKMFYHISRTARQTACKGGDCWLESHP